MASEIQKSWAERAVLIPWPPRSPDLKPCDINLRGYVKTQVYQPPMPQSLRKRISQAIANVDDSQLRRTREEFEYCFDIFGTTNETHIEYLQINVISFHAVFKLFILVSVTISKIHQFLINKTIYNSPESDKLTSRSSEVHARSTIQEIRRLLYNPNYHCHIQIVRH
jgi:hypothetical protein